MIDSNHATKQRTLSRIGVVLLIVGIGVGAFGLYSFGSSFFRPSDEFFANPTKVMDETSRSAFTGIFCIAIGGFSTLVGAKLVFFAKMGSIARYAAAETAPVTADTFNYVAHRASPGIEDLAGAVARGARISGAPVVKIRCRQCGYLESEDAKFCSACSHAV